MRKPAASVIIPTYNYAEHIREAVDSVLAQTFPAEEMEIIVVDDGSSDDTKRKVAGYGDKVRYVFRKHTGKAGATRKGIEMARGKYFFNLDADDIFLPDRVRAAIEVFEKNKGVVHVAHPARYRNEDRGRETEERVPEGVKGKVMRGTDLLEHMYRRNKLVGGGSTFSARTELLRKIAIPESVNMLTDECLVIFTLLKGDSYFCERPLSVWRMHRRQYSQLFVDGKGRHEREYLLRQSSKAMLDMVKESSAPESIKKLYELKTRIQEVYLKELDGEKTLGDIEGLWAFIWRNKGVVGKEKWKVLRHYSVWKRSLPAGVSRFARKMIGGTRENSGPGGKAEGLLTREEGGR
jgi:glycosyltransferase involved in cell wall biosynthesis